ncbi:uncharacterized protein LOC143024437 [Oratosquilla oratoria]|uniref:uncharacterized protein LOC143024437 n=1 Tax=Oratosquilla oratoria TaxID=337810 RepID=UPI003F76E61C
MHVYLTIVCGFLALTGTLAIPVVEMQPNGVVSVNSFLKPKKSLPTLVQLGACFRIFPVQYRNVIPIISYAIHGSDNELRVAFQDNELQLHCCEDRIEINVPFVLPLLIWSSLCFTLDLVQLTAKVYLQGQEKNMRLRVEGEISGLDVIGGGVLFIGQEQDSFSDGMDPAQSIRGLLGEFFMINRTLTSDEIYQYATCQLLSTLGPTLLDFRDIEADFEIGQDTEIINIPRDDICFQKPSYFILFPESRNFVESAKLCSLMSGHLPMPANSDENKMIVATAEVYKNLCLEVNENAPVWLGLLYNEVNETWHNYLSGEVAEYNILETEEAEAECIAVNTQDSRISEWQEQTCDADFCTVCQFDKPLFFYLRGLCTNSHFDRRYYVYGTENGMPVFLGTQNSKIVWMDVKADGHNGGTWKLIDIQDPTIYAELLDPSMYPISTNPWRLVHDNCEEEVISLKLTTCNQDQYTCSDGSCIHSSKRCDRRIDCPMQNDEMNCDTVIIRDGYQKEMSPPSLKNNEATTVTVDFKFITIRELNIRNSKLLLDIIVTRKWRDSRLYFRMVHEDVNLNLVEDVDGIWYPDSKFAGDDFSICKLETLNTIMWVKTVSLPLPDDDTTTEEDLIYQGNETDIFYEKYFSIEFICRFELANYPFDTQLCPITMRLRHDPDDFTKLIFGEIEFTGKTSSLEYQILGMKEDSLTLEGRSALRITLKFRNLYRYYITASYVPTFLLVLICFLTLMFDVNNFQDRVMVSLTALLVLAALFTQVSSDLPTTSYLKLIDVWFIFCIVVSFVIVALHVLVNRFTYNVMRVGSVSPMTAKITAKRETQSPERVNCVGRTVILLAILVFVVAYCSYIIYLLH